MTEFVARARRIDLPDRGGVLAAYELGPRDRPIDVVFSHANGFNAFTYRTVLGPAAAQGLRILAYDLRGHGASELPTNAEDRSDWSDLGDDLLALIAALDLKDVILAGHSMGGAASLMAADKTADRVRALALFEPVMLPRAVPGPIPGTDRVIATTAARRNRFETREAAVAGFEGRGAFQGWSRAALEDYVAGGLKPAPGGGFTLACTPEWENSGYRCQWNPVWPILDRLPMPTHILMADGYTSVHVEGETALLEGRGLARVEIIERTGHFLPVQKPAVVVETLLRLASETAPVA